jgi:hypothetical protein
MSDLMSADDFRDGISNGNLLEETDHNAIGCSVMISYCRNGTENSILTCICLVQLAYLCRICQHVLIQQFSFSLTDKAFVKLLYDALAVDERQIWIDWEVCISFTDIRYQFT